MIHQELNPFTCKLDRKTIILRRTIELGDVLRKDSHDQNRNQENLKKQVRRWASPSISQMTHWRLRWCQSSVHPWHPLHWLYQPLLEGEKKEKGEVLHLFRCYTHTHPAGAGTTLKGKRKKSGHKRRAKGQNSAGGEGNRRTSRTNLHGETDLTSTGHTPKPHNTLQRGTGQELGTDGGLVGDDGKTTRTIKLKGPSSTLGNRALFPNGTVVRNMFNLTRNQSATPAGKRHPYRLSCSCLSCSCQRTL